MLFYYVLCAQHQARCTKRSRGRCLVLLSCVYSVYLGRVETKLRLHEHKIVLLINASVSSEDFTVSRKVCTRRTALLG
jgi:hypothetical protein